jgi:hypothetical protein
MLYEDRVSHAVAKGYGEHQKCSRNDRRTSHRDVEVPAGSTYAETDQETDHELHVCTSGIKRQSNRTPDPRSLRPGGGSCTLTGYGPRDEESSARRHVVQKNGSHRSAQWGPSQWRKEEAAEQAVENRGWRTQSFHQPLSLAKTRSGLI